MADLKTIIKLTQEELKRSIPVEQAVTEALKGLSSREADVVARRAGLRNGQKETLAEIGQEFGVTRERVRQIENQGLKKLRGQLEREPLSELSRLAVSLVREHGGVMAQESLYKYFLPESQHTPSGTRAVALLLELGNVALATPGKKLRPFYAVSKAHERAVAQVIPALKGALADTRKPLPTETLVEQVRESDASEGIGYLLSEGLVESSLEIGTDFVTAPEDTWGLASWPEINPRNIRDKTLFMLRKVGTPMHFTEITEQIAQAKFDGKRVTTQAVHNELINGDEFVLIGRGIYALKEWGYIPGTVAEVIRDVLAKADTPVDREEIVEAVLKQRHVSRNTILINLQEKKLFARVGKHSYQLAE